MENTTIESELNNALYKSEHFEKLQNKFASDENFKKLFIQKYTSFLERFMTNAENESQKNDWIELAITSLSQCYIYSLEQNKFYSSISLLPQTDDTIIFHLRDILLETDPTINMKQNSLLHIWKSVKSFLKRKCLWSNFRLPFSVRKTCNEMLFSFFESSKDAQFFMYSIGLIVNNKDFDFKIVSDSDTHPFLRFIQGVLYKYLSKKSIYQLKIVTGWKDQYVSNFNSVYYLGLQRNLHTCEDKINEIIDSEYELAILISCINLYEEISCSGEFENYFYSCLLKNAFDTINTNSNEDKLEDCNFEDFQERLLNAYVDKVGFDIVGDSKCTNKCTLDSKFMKLKDIQNDLNEFLQEMHIPIKLISTDILKAFLIKHNIRPFRYLYYLVKTPINNKNSFDENRIMNYIKSAVSMEWKKINENENNQENKHENKHENKEKEKYVVDELTEKDIKSISKLLHEKESSSDSELDFVSVKVLECFFQKYIDSIYLQLETFNRKIDNGDEKMTVHLIIL